MKTYITYFDDRQVEEYKLVKTDDVIPFKGNDTTISGESINYLNCFYCELTTMYWIWKNTDDKLLCLKQYRRPFNSKKIPNEGEIITYAPLSVMRPINIQYGFCHGIKRRNLLDVYFKYKFGEESEIYTYWTKGKKMYTNNTMIINRSDFNKMCEFVFGILFDLDKQWGLDMNVEKYIENGIAYTEDRRIDYQQHFMAYIGERLVSAYISCYLKPIHEPRLATNGFFKPYKPKSDDKSTKKVRVNI